MALEDELSQTVRIDAANTVEQKYFDNMQELALKQQDIMDEEKEINAQLQASKPLAISMLEFIEKRSIAERD